MKLIRLISRLIFLLTRLLAVMYLLSCTYSAVVLALHKAIPLAKWVPIKTYFRVDEGQSRPRFEILLPATEKPLFLMPDTAWGVAELLLGLGLYGLFFYLLSRVFNAFRQEKLFTDKAVDTLQLFAKANFIFPPLFFCFFLVNPNYEVSEGETVILFLHLLLGIFAWFQATIFQEGFTLQNEIDLTI